MNDIKHIESLANTLISQYGDDALTVAMLRAAEFAAELNKEEWMKWESVISSPHHRCPTKTVVKQRFHRCRFLRLAEDLGSIQ